MAIDDQAGTDWTDSEVDLIVADYFAMLNMELAGQTYVKAQRNEGLRQFVKRSRGSIEFKHQNISAVLVKLGMPWIAGYKPMANYQNSLINGIERYLNGSNPIYSDAPHIPLPQFAAAESLFFEAPPSPEDSGLPESPALIRLIRKFDPALRDARNRTLGEKGEEQVYLHECTRLIAEERPDLAKRVKWISKEEGDGAGFDILSFDARGSERLIEVKTTTGHRLTPFFISANEKALSTERPEEFRLVRLYEFAKKPKAFELVPPLEEGVMMRPWTFRASFD